MPRPTKTPIHQALLCGAFLIATQATFLASAGAEPTNQTIVTAETPQVHIETSLYSPCIKGDDRLSSELARGRNAWARKCAYISSTMEKALNDSRSYVVFDRHCVSYPYVSTGSECTAYVPAWDSESCISGLALLGVCLF